LYPWSKLYIAPTRKFTQCTHWISHASKPICSLDLFIPNLNLCPYSLSRTYPLSVFLFAYIVHLSQSNLCIKILDHLHPCASNVHLLKAQYLLEYGIYLLMCVFNIFGIIFISVITLVFFITSHIQVGMRFLTERGQNVNGQPNIIYVSTDNGTAWLPLHEFVEVNCPNHKHHIFCLYISKSNRITKNSISVFILFIDYIIL